LILSSIEREVTFEFGVKAPLATGRSKPVNPSHDQIYGILFP
jgi:hypothetical protein